MSDFPLSTTEETRKTYLRRTSWISQRLAEVASILASCYKETQVRCWSCTASPPRSDRSRQRKSDHFPPTRLGVHRRVRRPHPRRFRVQRRLRPPPRFSNPRHHRRRHRLHHRRHRQRHRCYHYQFCRRFDRHHRRRRHRYRRTEPGCPPVLIAVRISTRETTSA